MGLKGCNISSYFVANFGFLLTYGAYRRLFSLSSSKCPELRFLSGSDVEVTGSSQSLAQEIGDGGSDIVDIGDVGGEEQVDIDDEVAAVVEAGDSVKEDSSEKLLDLLSSTKCFERFNVEFIFQRKTSKISDKFFLSCC